jgi:murein tripeptide amidase MpaA
LPSAARLISALLLAVSLTAPVRAQTTRPERTRFQETSSYADVLAFLDSLQQLDAGIQVGTLAVSPEGRRVPYVLASRPAITGAAEAHRSGKPVVYVQGNIHAGEVEGKEAAQMLVRDLTVGPLAPLLDSLVLIIVPIYNTDGNERWATGETNRPGQNPDVFIDLHTTNGSYHGYALTFTPGLNPNGNPARDLARDRLLPAVRERMRRRCGSGPTR